MSTSLESFVNVLRRSGLVEETVVAEQLDSFRSNGTTQTAEAFAARLVDADAITSWQAGKLLQGKHKGFFLGKYKLLKLLGKGGMSSVYLAEHVLMRRRCAIKVLPWKLVKDSSYLQRFHREAQAVAALDHPNIVRAYDIDHEKDGNLEIHFLVMEYVEGRNLYDMVQQMGPLSPGTAADYTRQGALGLEHAHKAGMVHRDVKPGNFIVDQNNVVKLMDLGLARLAQQEGDHSLTIAHDERVLGTADYLAPEQAVDSHLVDTRADIYSLGCTLYFLLAGRPPFHEGTLTQRLLAHQSKEPTPIEKLRSDVPESLLDILRRMMIKDREERVQTARDVADLLAGWLAEHGHTGEPTTDSGRLVSVTPAEDSPSGSLPLSPSTKVHEDQGTSRKKAASPATEQQSEEAAADTGELGDFLSSLSDVASGSSSQTSPKQKGTRSSPRLASSASASEELQAKPPTAKPAATSSVVTPPDFPAVTFNETHSPDETVQAEAETVPQSSEPKSRARRSLPIPEKYRIPAIAGGVVLLLVILIAFLISGSGSKENKLASPTDSTPTAPPESSPPEPKRPEVTGATITVGPQGNFGSISAAIKYIQDAGFGSPIREIQVAGNQTYSDAISIDNSGLGGFPRGLKIIGPEDRAARLKPTGGTPAILLNGVEDLTIENLTIDCQGLKQAVHLNGFLFGTRLVNLKFDNIENVAVFGDNAAGLTDQPFHIERCRFHGASAKAQGIHFDIDSRDFIIRHCRFLGPMQAGIAISGDASALTFQQNIFHQTATGILFASGNSHIGRIDFLNNTFHQGQRGIAFESGPPEGTEAITFERNLFASDEGPAVFAAREGVDAKKLSDQARPPKNNWTTQPVDSAASAVNIFASGRSGEPVEFVSEDPESGAFLKPTTDALKLPDSPAAQKFIGAVPPQ